MNNIAIQIPFEIHLTVDDIQGVQLDSFIESCTQLSGKPILIELEKGDFIHQPMFSTVKLGSDLNSVLTFANKVTTSLCDSGFIVKRLKIEVPIEFTEMLVVQKFTTSYFEWHGRVELMNYNLLLEICNGHKCHLSKNALKGLLNKRFITMREYGDISLFKQRVKDLSDDLISNSYAILKQEFEYCVYDNNSDLDNGWLPN